MLDEIHSLLHININGLNQTESVTDLLCGALTLRYERGVVLLGWEGLWSGGGCRRAIDYSHRAAAAQYGVVRFVIHPQVGIGVLFLGMSFCLSLIMADRSLQTPWNKENTVIKFN